MKRLNDLKKQLPSNAKLNTFEFTRVKGGADKKTDRPSGGNGFGNGNGNAFGNGNGNGG